MSQTHAPSTEPNPGRRGVNPSTPTPEDPREREPIHDPPVNPEQDIEQPEPVRQAEGSASGGEVIFDANKVER